MVSLSFVRASLFLFLFVSLLGQFVNAIHVEDDEDIIRKSIIYDKKTPDVFYCPQEKHNGMNNMLVKSKPLSKLCEYNAGDLPEGYRSDCYGNVDETLWACKEKKRIMKRRYPPGMEILEKYKPLTRKKRAEYYDMHYPQKSQSSEAQQIVTSVSSQSSRSSRTKTVKRMRNIEEQWQI